MDSQHNTATLRQPISRVAVTNAFLRSVYNWMAFGLCITAILAYVLTYTPLNELLLTPAAMPVFWVCAIAEIGLVFFLSFRINKLAAGTAATLFLVYSALNGVTLSFLLGLFTAGSVVQAFLATTGMFAFMSLYGMFTKRDLAGIGSFCVMGVFGLILAMLINLFFQSSRMDMLISFAGVAIFLGLTAYDTQLLKTMGESVPRDDVQAVRRATIMGALRLYLDFINLFIMLLRLMGDRR